MLDLDPFNLGGGGGVGGGAFSNTDQNQNNSLNPSSNEDLYWSESELNVTNERLDNDTIAIAGDVLIRSIEQQAYNNTDFINASDNIVYNTLNTARDVNYDSLDAVTTVAGDSISLARDVNYDSLYFVDSLVNGVLNWAERANDSAINFAYKAGAPDAALSDQKNLLLGVVVVAGIIAAAYVMVKR